MIHQQDYGHVSWHNQVSLVAGHPYPISIGYYQTTGAATISLFWTQPCVRIPSAIPRRNLYMPNSQVGPVTIGPVTCTKVDQVKALSNYLIDEFNLIPLKSMVVSVWVKKGLEDCRCAGYDGFTVKLQSRSNQNVATLLPKGPIIEGWQLFEAVFEVPVDSELDFFIDNGINNLPLFIDDLRFHPYNANMKSFVYNPFNLKPSAELDENNYASFYEYDDDGTLIRVKKETVKGIKTIQETRSGLQKNILDF